MCRRAGVQQREVDMAVRRSQASNCKGRQVRGRGIYVPRNYYKQTRIKARVSLVVIYITKFCPASLQSQVAIFLYPNVPASTSHFNLLNIVTRLLFLIMAVCQHWPTFPRPRKIKVIQGWDIIAASDNEGS